MFIWDFCDKILMRRGILAMEVEMNAGMIISGAIFGLCALVMFGIGISQLKSKEPVGFYSGIEPPAREQLSDVDAWNKKHGTMWIIYGVCIVASWIVGLIFGDSVYAVIPYTVGLIVPIVFMVIYHHKLVKRYFKG